MADALDVKTYDDDASLGKPCPSLEALDFIKGEKINIAPGKVYVLFFFNGFYKGAFAVHEEITALSERIPDVTFIAISNDVDKAAAEKYLGKVFVDENTKQPQRMATPYIAFDDKKALGKQFADLCNVSVHHVPQGIIVDATGKIAWRQCFTQTDTVASCQPSFVEQLHKVQAGLDVARTNGVKPRVVDEGEAADCADDMSLF